MYFPTSVATRLSAAPLTHGKRDEEDGVYVRALAPSPRKSFFVLVTRDGIALWRVRVCTPRT
jgi:RAB6A-GEF complex partner protein 1